MKKAISAVFLGGTVLALTACGGSGGSEFEGKWSCDDDKGFTVSIRNNGGNDYIMDDYPIIDKVSLTYKDGKLVGPEGVTFSIDKQSGKLIGMQICEMSRVE